MAQAVGWQRIEAALVFAAALVLLWWGGMPFAWWAAVLIFFAPDLAIAAYLAGPKVGAIAYNAVHLYGFGAGLMAVGAVAGLPVLSSLGLLWLAHASFDRMLGYGLKLPGGFRETHLGPIGKGA